MDSRLKNKTLDEIIDSVKTLFENKKESFYPYIEYVRFPKYKALKKNTKITFDFPLTVFVGENGTNKTSVIQALYGSPGNNSLGNYWFSTDVDFIDESNGKPCLIYGYYHEGAKKCVEVIKSRINKQGNLDYWEPSRPIKTHGMEVPKATELMAAGNSNTTRWDLMDKHVVFYDNKEYVSAYDLCFYHSRFKKTAKYNSVQSFIRSRSKHLAKVIENEQDSYSLFGTERVKSNKMLPADICEIMGWIMNKPYKTIRIVEHSFYNKNNNNYSPSKTVYITCNNGLEYSEAFAGSGEARIILMLNDILTAEDHSLILMDEPEISLHPGALEKLKIVLLWCILEKKHQIVVSTHSASMIRELPSAAIKVFENHAGTVNIYENIPFKNAFFSIGQEFDEKTIIFVEDDLAKHIIEDFLTKTRHVNWNDSIEVRIYPGGAENIIKNVINGMAIAKMEKVYFILDGDKNYFPYPEDVVHPEWVVLEKQKVDEGYIPNSANEKLGEIIQAITNVDINVCASGNSGKSNYDEKIKLQRGFLRFWERHVFFLTDDKCCPENALLGKEPEYDGKGDFVERARNKYSGYIGRDEILFAEREVIKGLDVDCAIYRHLAGLAFWEE